MVLSLVTHVPGPTWRDVSSGVWAMAGAKSIYLCVCVCVCVCRWVREKDKRIFSDQLYIYGCGTTADKLGMNYCVSRSTTHTATGIVGVYM